MRGKWWLLKLSKNLNEVWQKILVKEVAREIFRVTKHEQKQEAI